MTLTNPLPGITITSTNALVLQANASDLDGTIDHVDFYLSDVQVGSALTPPYSVTVSNLAVGSRTFYARAFDNVGASTVSSGVTINVKSPNEAPILDFREPQGGTYELPTNVTFTAFALDYDGRMTNLTLFANDQVLAIYTRKLTNAIYTYIWTNPPPGTYVPKAVARDNEGAVSTFSLPAFQVVPRNIRPSVRITNPSDGQIVTGPARLHVTVEASDSDGTIATVRLIVGETLFSSNGVAPFAFDLPVLTDGTYSLVAEAEDDRGGITTSSTVNFIVTTSAPRYEIIDIGTLLSSRSSWAYAINDQGRIIGTAENPEGKDRGYWAEAHPVFGFRFEILPAFPPLTGLSGPEDIWPQAINNMGQIVGSITATNLREHAFLYQSGSIRDLGTLTPSGVSSAAGINQLGHIVGSTTGTNQSVAFLYRNETLAQLNLGNVRNASATAINNSDQIVGYFDLSPGQRAFLYRAGDAVPEIIQLGSPVPDYPYSKALAINDNGQIALQILNGLEWSRAFLYQAGSMNELPGLGGLITIPHAINEHGIIVGESRDYAKAPSACIWQGGQVYNLWSLLRTNSGWRGLITATGINRLGQIVGVGYRTNSDDLHAFLLSPSPAYQISTQLVLNRQTGFFEDKLTITNSGWATLHGLRVIISGLPPGVETRNASIAQGITYIESPYDIARNLAYAYARIFRSGSPNDSAPTIHCGFWSHWLDHTTGRHGGNQPDRSASEWEFPCGIRYSNPSQL